MTKEQALHSFWSSFGLTAYDENSVPSGTVFPYITYQVITGNFNTSIQMNASVWYKSQSWADVTNKVNAISDAITMGGKIITFDDGALWITRSNIFSQRMQDTDDSIRRINMSINVEFISEN